MTKIHRKTTKELSVRMPSTLYNFWPSLSLLFFKITFLKLMLKGIFKETLPNASYKNEENTSTSLLMHWIFDCTHYTYIYEKNKHNTKLKPDPYHINNSREWEGCVSGDMRFWAALCRNGNQWILFGPILRRAGTVVNERKQASITGPCPVAVNHVQLLSNRRV